MTMPHEATKPVGLTVAEISAIAKSRNLHPSNKIKSFARAVLAASEPKTTTDVLEFALASLEKLWLQGDACAMIANPAIDAIRKELDSPRSVFRKRVRERLDLVRADRGSLSQELREMSLVLFSTPKPNLGREKAGFQCEPKPAVTDDGFCEWVCPKPIGYLMQCCDCGLIHEVETRVAKYEPRPSEEFTVSDDPDLQAQLRMKRRDDLSRSK